MGPIFPFALIPFREDRSIEHSISLVYNYLLYLTLFISFFFLLGIIFLKCFENIHFREDEIDQRVSESRLISEDNGSLLESNSEPLFDLENRCRL